MNRALKLACVVVAGMVLVAGAMAQSVATADLRGTVKDPSGAAVNNATVTARDESRAFERSTTTDAEGNYQLLLLPPGHYTLTVEATGFGKMVVDAVFNRDYPLFRRHQRVDETEQPRRVDRLGDVSIHAGFSAKAPGLLGGVGG